MRVGDMVCVVALAAGLASLGCGSSDQRRVEEPEAQEPAPEPKEDVLMPQEQLDSVEAFLGRQRKFVARCWVKALDAKEVPARDSGKISIMFHISASGAVSKVRVTKASHRSEALESCVIGKADRWKISGISQSMDYSYTFGFQRL